MTQIWILSKNCEIREFNSLNPARPVPGLLQESDVC